MNPALLDARSQDAIRPVRIGLGISNCFLSDFEFWWTMAITVYPVGGLGNQLFIYGAGLAEARRVGADLLVDPLHLILDPKRDLELTSFESDFTLIKRSNSHFPLLLRQKMLTLRNGRIDRPEGSTFLCLPYAKSRFRTFASHRKKFWGYLQSWRYFESIDTELREQLRSIKKKSAWFDNVSLQIRNAPRTIGLHVRRGDYVGNSSMGEIPRKYYESAINLICAGQNDVDIFVFSDDPNLTADCNFIGQGLGRVHYAENRKIRRPIEVVNLLASCDHVVMANSTLSWWGAWLGARETQIVIYPRPWLTGFRMDERDFALPTWFSLGWES